MYCPVCFAESLKLTSTGVINLSINGKQMDTGRFLFNLLEEKPEVLKDRLTEKIDQFLKWYSGFNNKDPISEITLTTTNAVCTKGCKIPVGTRFTIVGIIFSEKEIKKILEELGSKHKLPVKIKF